jgi:hypothetical protein
MTRYRSEFGMAEIPRPVQRVVFPIVVFVGRLLGLHRRFRRRSGAGEPSSSRRVSLLNELIQANGGGIFASPLVLIGSRRAP